MDSSPLPEMSPAQMTPNTEGFHEVEQDLQRLITRNAEWHAASDIVFGRTARVALTLGDGRAFQQRIENAVGTVKPRPPQPVTIGPRLRATLIATPSDAAVSPTSALNESVGLDTKVYFEWQIQPQIEGNLHLTAYIECIGADGRVMTTEEVPLSISVHLPPEPPVSVSDRFRDLAGTAKEFWGQLTFIAAVCAAAARLGWKWYSRRRGQFDNRDDVPAQNGTEKSSPDVDETTSVSAGSSGGHSH